MTNRQEGGRKAAVTNKTKYGENFYGKLAERSAKMRTAPRTWQLDHEAARKAGAKGGKTPTKSTDRRCVQCNKPFFGNTVTCSPECKLIRSRAQARDNKRRRRVKHKHDKVAA